MIGMKKRKSIGGRQTNMRRIETLIKLTQPQDFSHTNTDNKKSIQLVKIIEIHELKLQQSNTYYSVFLHLETEAPPSPFPSTLSLPPNMVNAPLVMVTSIPRLFHLS